MSIRKKIQRRITGDFKYTNVTRGLEHKAPDPNKTSMDTYVPVKSHVTLDRVPAKTTLSVPDYILKEGTFDISINVLNKGGKLLQEKIVHFDSRQELATAMLPNRKPGLSVASSDLSNSRIVFIHALRNAILPIIAMVGLDIGIFMSGAVVVESVFGWPGIGQLAWQAIQRLDIPIIVGVTIVSATFIVLGNLIADIASAFSDPKIRIN